MSYPDYHGDMLDSEDEDRSTSEIIIHTATSALRDRISELEEELRGERMCDGCAGKKEFSQDCGCKGTGLMSEMVVSLRQLALIDQPNEIKRLHDQIGDLVLRIEGLEMQIDDMEVRDDFRDYDNVE